MKKIFLIILISFLVACGPSNVGEPEAVEESESETAVVTESESAEPETEAAGESETAAETAEEEDPPASTGSTDGGSANVANDYQIATTPQEAAQLKESDWAKGAANPIVSIVEYGDFQ